MTDHGDFIWHDLVTPDQKSSGHFLSELLGWTTKEVDAGPFGVYTLFQKDGRDVAGMMNPTPESPLAESGQSRWHTYVSVANVDECAERVPNLAGKLLVPPHDVPGVGRVCLIAEPNGIFPPWLCSLLRRGEENGNFFSHC